MSRRRLPNHATCEVCEQIHTKEFMREFEGGVFVDDPECLDEYEKLIKREDKNE